MWGATYITYISYFIYIYNKKHPLQNRTNVQIKGGGVKGLLNNLQKNCTFLNGWLPLRRHTNQIVFLGVHVFEYGLCLYLDYIPVRVVHLQASKGNEVPASVIRNGEKSPTLFSSFTSQVFLRCIFSSRL